MGCSLWVFFLGTSCDNDLMGSTKQTKSASPRVSKPKTIRSLKGLRAGTDADVKKIRNSDWKRGVRLDALRACDGDLRIDGDYDGSMAGLCVHGDLVVTGTLDLDETGTLVVTGSLTCKNLNCEGNLEVQGDVNVDETIIGYYEAGITFFNQKVRAVLFLQGNHDFEYDEDELDVKAHIKFSNNRVLKKSPATNKALKLLSDDALDALGRLIGISENEPKLSPRERDNLLRTKGFLR